MILASEDIGLADPQALRVTAAARGRWRWWACRKAAFILSQAVIYCALAPKSGDRRMSTINRAVRMCVRALRVRFSAFA